MPDAPHTQPKIGWDGTTWSVSLPVEGGKLIEASWRPGATHVVRIREKASEEWSVGFETPVPACTFAGLEPDTDYEVQVRTRTARGESAPAFLKIRTDPVGGATNIVPFPKR